MLFKLSTTIRHLDFHDSNCLVVPWPNEARIWIEFRAPNDDERKIGHKSYNAMLDAYGEFEPTKKSEPTFAAIAEGRRPPLGKQAKSANDLVIREGPSEGLQYYPNPFAAFVDQTRDMLYTPTKSMASVLRWRYAQEGPAAGLSHRGFFFSTDSGKTWHTIPGRYTLKNVTPRQSVLRMQSIDTEELSRLACSVGREPLAHELLREAKALEFASSRSALIVSISAAEVAAKSVIINRLPEAAWLVESVQSPPLVNILIEYLPVLFPGVEELYVPTKSEGLVKTILEGVQIRNRIIHTGASPPSDEKITEIICAVEALLWVCDCCDGHEWAEGYVRQLRAKGI